MAERKAVGGLEMDGAWEDDGVSEDTLEFGGVSEGLEDGKDDKG